jgi:hypothetical protein
VEVIVARLTPLRSPLMTTTAAGAEEGLGAAPGEMADDGEGSADSDGPGVDEYDAPDDLDAVPVAEVEALAGGLYDADGELPPASEGDAVPLGV